MPAFHSMAGQCAGVHMNIILAEVRADGSEAPEQSFDQGVIRVGREAGECDIAFDNAVYPMVSRRHAELRWHEGRWMLVDLNSSYGTFLNGQRVTTPQMIPVGGRMQFGQSGPILQVVWFEVLSESVFNYQPSTAATPTPTSTPVSTPSVPPVQTPPAQVPSWETPPVSGAPTGQAPPQARVNPFEAQAAAAPPQAAAAGRDAGVPGVVQGVQPAQLEFSGGDARPPFKLGQGKVSIGRDPGCDIPFESSSATVSRNHAEIRLENGDYVVADNKSFNGTLVNEQRITAPTPLYNGDAIQLGIGGPVLRFVSESRVAPKGASLAGQRSVLGAAVPIEDIASKTMVVKLDDAKKFAPTKDSAQPQLMMTVGFGGKKELSIGRSEANDIRLDGLQISNRHARLVNTGSEIVIDDLNSTNGVFVNGRRVSRQTVNPGDAVQIGAFLIQVDLSGSVGVFDTRSKTRVDAIALTKDVKSRFGGKIRLVDGISLSIQPNEFVGLLGPSGAGKSTLMDALNGMRPADSGNVLINNLDLYRHIDSLKHAIGYVPQDDVLHRELTVYRTLYYTAKLRLSRDVSRDEINRTIDEVLDVTGLTERKDVRIDKLSGGQRKRVSIAVELITKPSVIFLDEPTSGLDPATEGRVMNLFRQIAESGRTVVMTTHAMENVKLFDKIVVMMRGKLAFYGKPEEALTYFRADSYKELYDKIELPAAGGAPGRGETGQLQALEQSADDWKQKFLRTPEYKEYVHDPLKQLGTLQPGGKQKKRRLGIVGAVRQWATLSRRYLEVLLKDKLNLFILFAQAPIIALMTFLVTGSNQPRDFVYFVLALVSIWFGTSVAAREIIREKPVYRRERMVNLGILPYLASKLFVLGIIVGLQCLLLFAPLKIFDLIGLSPMPGQLFGIPQFWVMLLTAGVGIALGLLVSALVKTSEMATSLVPIILIPQLLFSGLVGVPGGFSKVAGLAMPAAWSFDTIKRYSTLDTLEEEGADPRGKTNGLGLYKYTETENEKVILDARRSIEEYQRSAEEKFKKYDADVRSGLNPPMPRPDEPPAIPAAKKIPDDLSGYITFLHPWMNEILNQIVLMLMFGMLVIVTLIVLRMQDIS